MTAIAFQGTQMPARSRPRRINVDLSDEQFARLNEARRQDHLTTADRVRALLDLSFDDPTLAKRVATRVSEMTHLD